MGWAARRRSSTGAAAAGDLAANTIVVRHPAAAEPDFEKILPGKFNSFREYPHLAARLRQNVTP